MIWFVVLFSIISISTAIRRVDLRHLVSVSEKQNATHTSQRIAASKVKVVIPSTPDGHLVTDPLPLTKAGEALTIRHWAGHLPASGNGHNYFFYWLFEPETVDESTPLLIWLNGGPACSSMDGLFLENGPIQWTVVDGKFMLQQNPYSWHNAPAYTLYIDQPVGTGLSFTTNKGYPRNDEEVNIDFYYFLTSFFDFHADKFVNGDSVKRPLFFSGESHAGHYIPSMMNYILKKNRDGGQPYIPVAGGAIGNGWIDPVYQYSPADAAYGHGIVDRAQRNSLAAAEQECQTQLQRGQYSVPVCFSLLNSVVGQSFGKQSPFKVSIYDVRVVERKNQPRTYPLGHRVIECYLGGRALPRWERDGTMDTNIVDRVLEVIHATAASVANQRYEECTDPPYEALAYQDGKGVVLDIVQILDDPTKPRLLFFNGVQDLIVNHVGNERALQNLPWHGRDDWTAAQRYAWWTARDNDTQPAGFMKEYSNLSFLKVPNAGHMVPMDLPEIAFEMMKIFMSGGSFNQRPQKLASVASNPPKSCHVCDTCEEPEECPNTSCQTDCAEKVTEATLEAEESMARSIQGGDDGDSSFLAVFGAVIIVVAVLIYGVMEMRKRQLRYGDECVASHVELQQTRYHDEE